MATLVLGAVGGVVAGPVGAAIGALAGQAVDASWLSPATRQGPRLSDLKVQVSSYGTAIPPVFGTLRVAGCVIWSTDLLESRATASGGKGQPSTTTYSYSASFAVALSGRRIASVGRIWADGNLLRGAAGDWKSAVGAFRLYLGDEEQAADPLIASAEGTAPAHRGVAYAVFEQLQLAAFGNRIPQLTFELMADTTPPGPDAIAAALGGAAVTGGPVAGPLTGYAAAGSASDALDLLAQAASGWWGPAGDGYVLLTGDAPATALADTGVRATDGDPRSRAVAAIEGVPKTQGISYYDPVRDWQAGVQRARRPGAGQASATLSLPAALPADAAKALAEATLARAEADRTTRIVAPGLGALAVPPGAVVSIAGEGGSWRVTATELEGWALKLTLAPLAPGPAGVAVAASAGRVLAAPDLLVGHTRLVAAELPPLSDTLLTGPRVTVLAGGDAPGWRSASLLTSTDGNRWSEAGATAAPAIIGTVAMSPGPAPATLVDRANALEVVLADPDALLADADDNALDGGANLALAGSEVLQFGAAEPLGGGRWRLTRLWRGRRGSEAGTIAAGDAFAVIDPAAALAIDLPAALAGGTLSVMASGVGDPDPVTATAPLTGMSMRPPSPVHLSAAEAADGSATVSWVRRSRVGWPWLDGADAPLGEESEAYRVTWQGVDQIVTAPALTMPAAIRAGGGTLVVRQLGTNGEGPPASLFLSPIA